MHLTDMEVNIFSELVKLGVLAAVLTGEGGGGGWGGKTKQNGDNI